MASSYNFFQTQARKVHPVIEDILTQRAEFTELNFGGTPTQLKSSPSWLLGALEAQHQKRCDNSIDLSKDPLMLILELTAYYFAKKGPSLVTSKDGFIGELEGACKGAPLIAAYTKWFESVKDHAADTLNLRDPKNLSQLLNEFKLNNAATLATQLEDVSCRLSSPR